MRYPTIIVLTGLLLLVAGCQGSAGGSDTGTSAPRDPFLGGSEGLEIEFLDGEPPEEVTDQGVFPFQAIVTLQNQGEFDLKRDDVRVDLIGFLPEDFGANPSDLDDRRPEDDLIPKIRDSEGNIQDPILTEVTFPEVGDTFNFHGSVTGNTVFIFRADVCYKYQTKALSQICVLQDLININDDSICDPSTSKTTHSSASPLQVSRFRQTVSGRDKISFSFDVTHSGDGDVYKEGDATSPPGHCPKDTRERREKLNRVKVTVDTGLSNLRCVGFEGSTTGFITLVNGKRTVTCTQELDPDRNDFTKNVDITLDFNYRDDAEREVLVKHLISG